MAEHGFRVDAHHHVWDLTVRDQPWTAALPALRRSFPFDELRPWLNRNAVDATVLVETINDPAETPELLRLAEVEPLIGGVVGWIDLTSADPTGAVERLRAGPGGEFLVGVRHQVQGEPDPRWLCRPDVVKGLAAVSSAGLTFDLLVRPAQWPSVVEVVRSRPELSFVLNHAGKPAIDEDGFAPWHDFLTELGAHPNVVVKLSGLLTETKVASPYPVLRRYVEVLFDLLGPDRLMFGSDWPVCLLETDYDEVVEFAEELCRPLGRDGRARLFGATAAAVYRLER